MFYAVGFILAMHYGSVIVVAALALVFMFYWYVRPNDFPARFLCNAVPSTTRIVVSLICVSVLANGFVMVWFDGWRRLTSLLKSAMAAPLSQSGLEVAAFGFAVVAATALITWRFRAIVQWFASVPLGRAAVNLFGRMAIGWTVGVNVFAFDTWQNGFWHALTSAKTVRSLGDASAPDILDVLNFIWFRPWNLMIALVAIGGVICLIVHLANPRQGKHLPLFAGVLALGLVGLNTAAAWSEIKTGYSGEAYGIGRYFFPLLVGLPAVAFALTSTRKGLISVGALLLLLLAVSDFHAYARTMKPRIELWKKIGAEAAAAVDDFLASHPDGEVVCLNGVVSPYQCSIAYGNFWFLNFYVSNIKNPPPPPYVTQHRVRTQYGGSCDTLESCLGYERGKPRHTLVVARQSPKPSMAYRLIDQNADKSRSIGEKLTLFELADK